MEYLLKKRVNSQRGGLSGRRSEILPRRVTTNTYRDVLNEIKRRRIFNIIVDVQNLPIFFRIVCQKPKLKTLQFLIILLNFFAHAFGYRTQKTTKFFIYSIVHDILFFVIIENRCCSFK